MDLYVGDRVKVKKTPEMDSRCLSGRYGYIVDTISDGVSVLVEFNDFRTEIHASNLERVTEYG